MGIDVIELGHADDGGGDGQGKGVGQEFFGSGLADKVILREGLDLTARGQFDFEHDGLLFSGGEGGEVEQGLADRFFGVEKRFDFELLLADQAEVGGEALEEGVLAGRRSGARGVLGEGGESGGEEDEGKGAGCQPARRITSSLTGVRNAVI
jgi:hypothetical protein